MARFVRSNSALTAAPHGERGAKEKGLARAALSHVLVQTKGRVPAVLAFNASPHIHYKGKDGAKVAEVQDAASLSQTPTVAAVSADPAEEATGVERRTSISKAGAALCASSRPVSYRDAVEPLYDAPRGTHFVRGIGFVTDDNPARSQKPVDDPRNHIYSNIEEVEKFRKERVRVDDTEDHIYSNDAEVEDFRKDALGLGGLAKYYRNFPDLITSASTGLSHNVRHLPPVPDFAQRPRACGRDLKPGLFATAQDLMSAVHASGHEEPIYENMEEFRGQRLVQSLVQGRFMKNPQKRCRKKKNNTDAAGLTSTSKSTLAPTPPPRPLPRTIQIDNQNACIDRRRARGVLLYNTLHPEKPPADREGAPSKIVQKHGVVPRAPSHASPLITPRPISSSPTIPYSPTAAKKNAAAKAKAKPAVEAAPVVSWETVFKLHPHLKSIVTEQSFQTQDTWTCRHPTASACTLECFVFNVRKCGEFDLMSFQPMFGEPKQTRVKKIWSKDHTKQKSSLVPALSAEDLVSLNKAKTLQMAEFCYRYAVYCKLDRMVAKSDKTKVRQDILNFAKECFLGVKTGKSGAPQKWEFTFFQACQEFTKMLGAGKTLRTKRMPKKKGASGLMRGERVFMDEEGLKDLAPHVGPECLWGHFPTVLDPIRAFLEE